MVNDIFAVCIGVVVVVVMAFILGVPELATSAVRRAAASRENAGRPMHGTPPEMRSARPH